MVFQVWKYLVCKFLQATGVEFLVSHGKADLENMGEAFHFVSKL